MQAKEANKKIATLKEAATNNTTVQSSMQRNDVSADKEKLIFAETTIANMKKQLVDVVIEANRKHSELQTKLQSYEGVSLYTLCTVGVYVVPAHGSSY